MIQQNNIVCIKEYILKPNYVQGCDTQCSYSCSFVEWQAYRDIVIPMGWWEKL